MVEQEEDFISVRKSPPGLKTIFCFVVLGCLTFTVQNDRPHAQHLVLEDYFHIHLLKRKNTFLYTIDVCIQYDKYFLPSS